MRAYERLLKYVIIHTASSEESKATPTTQRQFDLSKYLADEMRSIGLSDVFVDEHAYVYGHIPASAGFEAKTSIAFIAHLDTVPDFSGENVKPQITENYDGTAIELGTSGKVLDPAKFPHLNSLRGQTLITTDGTTVLGADDKAGIAEIMTAAERVINENIPHGEINICFTPDEEVGHGAALLDMERLGAAVAYTVDGGEVNEINYETFNAAAAKWEITGFNIHPGDAKDKMINASLVAMEINALLPPEEIPAKTEGYEGFFHLTDMSGSVEKAELSYIIRDHDAARFEARKAQMGAVENTINAKYGAGTAKLAIKEQYRNMAEKIREHYEVVEIACRAIERAGLVPVTEPIRGGTDGAQLSFRGLPCPNLGTGGYSFHGPFEHITAERMDTVTGIITDIIKLFAE